MAIMEHVDREHGRGTVPIADVYAQIREFAAASGSPRDVLKTAFQYYDFMDEGLWLRMLRARNDSAHIYDADKALRLVDDIIRDYIPEFERVESGLTQRYGDMLTS